MENSFFEYRNKTGADSDSDDEIIDNSLVAEDFYTPRKKPAVKNQTVFVAESDESSTDGKVYTFEMTLRIKNRVDICFVEQTNLIL